MQLSCNYDSSHLGDESDSWPSLEMEICPCRPVLFCAKPWKCFGATVAAAFEMWLTGWIANCERMCRTARSHQSSTSCARQVLQLGFEYKARKSISIRR